uniref:Putative HIT family protein n=1 Tax=uncultured Acidobacteriota bacterium TaxID=171953 RepID=Q7X2Y9_9BACT|nr:putative HIT family protein [uncultured Acidobacteriota bacterium]
MDRLWSPWRSEYIASGDSKAGGCVFCDISAHPELDERNFVLHRAAHSLVVLNLYPYTSGHLLIIPYEHVPELDGATKQTTDEMMDLTKRCQTALRLAYKPTGFNVGMNLGQSAGAGIVDHIHIHILPRWVGDTNFMTAAGETRVLPEDLKTTFEKLRSNFQ